jgi:hypothetical protein
MGEVRRVSVPFTGEVMTGEVTADGERLLTVREVTRLLGIRPDTWRTYVSRGQAPRPDFPDLDTPVNIRVPRWRLDTVADYYQARRRRAWKLPKQR